MENTVEPILVAHLRKHYLNNFYTKQGELCSYLLMMQRLRQIASQYYLAATLLSNYHSNANLLITDTLYRTYELILSKMTLISTALIKSLPPRIHLAKE